MRFFVRFLRHSRANLVPYFHDFRNVFEQRRQGRKLQKRSSLGRKSTAVAVSLSSFFQVGCEGY
jgi:hypothetical protein